MRCLVLCRADYMKLAYMPPLPETGDNTTPVLHAYFIIACGFIGIILSVSQFKRSL